MIHVYFCIWRGIKIELGSIIASIAEQIFYLSINLKIHQWTTTTTGIKAKDF